MRLEEIDIGKTDESVREAVLNNMGRQAIIHDFKEGLIHVVISEKQYYDDTGIYHVHFQDKREDKDLEYHDLRKLIILHRAGTEYLLPDSLIKKP